MAQMFVAFAVAVELVEDVRNFMRDFIGTRGLTDKKGRRKRGAPFADFVHGGRFARHNGWTAAGA